MIRRELDGLLTVAVAAIEDPRTSGSVLFIRLHDDVLFPKAEAVFADHQFGRLCLHKNQLEKSSGGCTVADRPNVLIKYWAGG